MHNPHPLHNSGSTVTVGLSNTFTPIFSSSYLLMKFQKNTKFTERYIELLNAIRFVFIYFSAISKNMNLFHLLYILYLEKMNNIHAIYKNHLSGLHPPCRSIIIIHLVITQIYLFLNFYSLLFLKLK
jgi:hypothetical protein